MEHNVCKFISTKKPDEAINIINFVYECIGQKDFVLSSVYSVGLVTDGNGIFHTPTEQFSLKRGDLFVTFSAKPYFIENTGGLKYLYISFTGLRALTLIKRIGITHTSPVFGGFESLVPLWQNTLNISNDENGDLFCEGLLLYSLGFICKEEKESSFSDNKNGILLAKQYVDMNYADSSLNLKSVSEKFSYNPKYFSFAFKNMVRINFSEYLKIRRLNLAVSLIESGVTNVRDLCDLCGYNDPLYFSKSFKEVYGVSPKKYGKQ